MRARPSIAKRSREKDRAERKRDKADRREARKAERLTRDSSTEAEEDPDIAGIVPGPQALDPELFGSDYFEDGGSGSK